MLSTVGVQVGTPLVDECSHAVHAGIVRRMFAAQSGVSEWKYWGSACKAQRTLENGAVAQHCDHWQDSQTNDTKILEMQDFE